MARKETIGRGLHIQLAEPKCTVPWETPLIGRPTHLFLLCRSSPSCSTMLQ